MPRIAWIEDEDAKGETAEAFARARAASASGQVAAILRTMSLRPDFMTTINAASQLHFSDGALFNLFVRLADAFDIHPSPVMDPAGIPKAVTDR